MTKFLFSTAFFIGAFAILWIGRIFLGADLLGLGVTILIGGVYIIGTWELLLFRRETVALKNALAELNDQTQDIKEWLLKLSPGLQSAVRLRIEGERNNLPAPIVTPFLVGLLVMLGLLGTFVGMVDTLNGAVGALEGDNELEAIRAGLAAPIEGLGLAFGTSVAGVAGSAMLGLLSTISRRERVQMSYLLDTKVGNELKHLSVNYQQQLAFKAIQDQADALPKVAQTLTLLAGNLEKMTQDIGENLLSSQVEFQNTVTQSYQGLNDSLNHSLKTSLSENEKLIRTNIEPITEKLMPLSGNLEKMTQEVTNNLLSSQTEFQATVTQSYKALNESLDKSLKESLSENEKLLRTSIQPMAEKSLAQLNEVASATQQQLIDVSQQQLSALNDAVTNNSKLVKDVFDSGLKQQGDATQAIVVSMNESIVKVSSELQNNSQVLLDGFADNQDILTKQQQFHATQFSYTITEQLEQMRVDESQRTDAAIERLGELESVVSKHLTSLGQSLEEPMTRLIETASQTPKAAAQVIEKLRGEISKNIERDNDLLEERTSLMQRLELLSDAVEKNTREQQQSIASLVDSSTLKLTEVSTQFGTHLESEVSKLSNAADYFTASTVEINGLGEAFNAAVMNFSESNDLLIENLTRIEETLEKSNNRSDEQLNNYVAQAREVIDHNLLSHKEILDAVKQHLHQSKIGAA